MADYSHLQRRPTSKQDYKQIMSSWRELIDDATELKDRINKNGTDDEVRPYRDRLKEIIDARYAWIDQYDYYTLFPS